MQLLSAIVTELNFGVHLFFIACKDVHEAAALHCKTMMCLASGAAEPQHSNSPCACMQALEAAVALRELVLSCNVLEGLRGLGALTALTRLDASHNRLSSLAGLTARRHAKLVCSAILTCKDTR